MSGIASPSAWATIFLTIGVGTFTQVFVEVSGLVTHGGQLRGGALVNWTTFSGVTADIAIMYVTALVVLG